MSELSRLTSPEAGRALGEARVALIPIGATEQHGPHLELRTDIAIAEALARRIETRLGAEVILCPPLAVGVSEHHLAFPGTLSLRPATLMAYLRDVVESLAQHGVRKVLVVNGHGGNVDPVRVVSRDIRRETGVEVAHVMWGQVISDATAKHFQQGRRYHHACEIETSLAVECDPALLRPERLGDVRIEAPLDGFTDPPFARFDLPQPFGAWSSDGALGDPGRYSEETGRELVDLFVDRTVDFLTWFVSHRPDAGADDRLS